MEYHCQPLVIPQPLDPSKATGKVTVSPEHSYTFNNTEAILRLSDNLGSVKNFHCIHYDVDNPPNTTLMNHDHLRHPTSPPLQLSSTIWDLLSSCSKLYNPALRFETTKEAAIQNLQILQEGNFGLDKICNEGERAILNFRSEFKSEDELNQLFRYNLRWHWLRMILTKGVDFNLQCIDEDLRRKDLAAVVARGNHKLALKNSEFLSEALKKEVEQRRMIALPADCYDEIPGLVLNPMGVATHVGITDTGEFLPKQRLTHDLSFPGAYSSQSINSRIYTSKLEPCMFSHIFLRIIHYIVALRHTYPRTRIWIRKEDFKSAFRRIHLNAITAYQ